MPAVLPLGPLPPHPGLLARAAAAMMGATFAVILLCGAARAGALPCLMPPHDRPEGEVQTHLAGLLADLRPLLDHAPAMALALHELGPALCLDDGLQGAEGYFEPDAMRIVLHGGLDRGLQLGILLHELRHLEQFHRGICPSDRLAIGDHARMVFAIEADASAISLLLAWQRLLAGDPAIWEALMNWPSQSDIAISLAQEFFASADEGRMAAAAFARWYALDQRREGYYVDSCQAYLDQQDRSRRLPQYDRLPPDFLTAICRLPDGRPYPCAEPDPFPPRPPPRQRPDPGRRRADPAGRG